MAKGKGKEQAWCKDPMEKHGKATRPAAHKKAAARRAFKADASRFAMKLRRDKAKRRKLTNEQASMWGNGHQPAPIDQ